MSTIIIPGRGLLAAPLLGERGGGIGQVSELLWDSMRDAWPDRVDVITLLKNGHPHPTAADKLRFGVELASRQILAKPAWVVFSHLGLARAARYIPAMARAPYAVFLHGIEVWQPLDAPALETLQRATLLIANSRFTAKAATAANPSIGRIEVCPLALSKEATARGPAESRSDDRTVLVVGRLASGERYKGHEQLLRAWPALLARVPDARLSVVGDGDDAPRLRQIAVDVGVQSSVQFTGFLTREALDAAYAEAALFALPSRGEGFGLVYLEAMAHALPCLGSLHDAASEVIADGETGVLVNPTDVGALAESIADLLESPASRRAMGEAGRARVIERFGYERFRTQVTSLLSTAFGTEARAD